MKVQHDGFDEVLVAPTEKNLAETLESAVKVANARCRTGLVDLRSATTSDIWRRMTDHSEGFWQRISGSPRDKENQSGLAVAWWSDRIGRRHVRVRGVRWYFGSDSAARNNILAPFTESRPPVWLIYPDYIYLAGEGEDQKILAACPCGMTGTLDAIGWMGDRCAACHDRSEEGQELADRTRVAPWTIEGTSVVAVTFSPDGALLAACTLSSGPHVRDLATGETRGWKTEGRLESAADLAFLPDGGLVWSQGRDVRILDPHTFEQRGGFQAESGVYRFALSPDGSLLALQGRDLNVWNLRTGETRFPVSRYSVPPLPCCFVFTPDSKGLAVGMWDGTIRWWETAQGTPGATWTLPVTVERHQQELAISPDGRYLASLDTGPTDNLRLWDILAGKILRAWTLNRSVTRSAMRLMAFAPDGRTLVVGLPGGVFGFCDVVAGGDPVYLVSAPKPGVHTLAFSPDGDWLAVGCDRALVKLWPWRALLTAAAK
jgi:WD40 repeat protein